MYEIIDLESLKLLLMSGNTFKAINTVEIHVQTLTIRKTKVIVNVDIQM